MQNPIDHSDSVPHVQRGSVTSAQSDGEPDLNTAHEPGTILHVLRNLDSDGDHRDWFFLVVGCPHGNHYSLASAEECAARIISQS